MRKLNMPRRLSSSAARTHGGNMLFMLPTIILFCIVVLIPFFQGIPYSFTNWKSIVSETKEFNGLKNYIYLIKNKYFQDSLLVTFKFTMLNYHVKVGLVPIRRDVTPRPGIFNWEKAEERCAAAVAYIEEHFTSENVSFVDLKGINAVDVLYSDKDVDAVIERFQAEKVDAVFLINGNFGNEEVAGAVAKAIGKPVLLWGPQDTVFEADGTRYTDSQCGLFGMSRQLQRMNVPFTYIENCRIEDPIFTEGFLRFVGVACAVKNFKGMRVAQVGMRPKPFCSVIFNESDLMDKFDIHVIPVNLAVIQDKYNRILETRKDELAEGVAKLRQMYEIDDLSEPVLDKVYAFVLLYEEIFEEYNVAAVSAECWTAMQLMVGAMPCAAYPLLADMGYIIGCESDMHATLTQVVLKSLTLGQKKPFLGEFTTRHPSDRNVELLWHCGPFAYSLKKHGTGAKMVNMRQWMQVEDGHFTVARIDQDHGNYSIAVCECDSAEGPYTFGSYMWGKFKDLPGVERKLIEGPYIHHMSEIEGSLTDSIREFCKYVPGLTFDGLD